MTITIEAPATREVTAMYEAMLLIRKFEEQSAAMQAAGQSPSMCTSVGQEASAVGVMRALDSRDQILTNHRSAGHLLARGADPRRIRAEIMGRATGYCKGKSGSLHISVKELGVVLTSTIVGGELSLATGVALSKSMTNDEGIVVVFFGDGAATEGIFHEAMNLAKVWDLPILFVCENNQWQAFVRKNEVTSVDHISDWAAGYGVPARTVDGTDVEKVYEAARDAVDYVRTTRKPYFLETYMYRFRGHMEPDNQAYVDAVELAKWKERDPITMLEQRLIEREEATPEELAAVRQRVERLVDEAGEFALHSPFPDFSEMTTDVYA